MDGRSFPSFPELISTELPHVYTVPPWPPDFDPGSASQQELWKHGIMVRRPAVDDDPRLVAAWRRAFSRPWPSEGRVFPTPMTSPRGPRRHVPRNITPVEGGFTSENWAGGLVSGTWNSVIGTWTVPVISIPPRTPVDVAGGWETSIWIGLDGFGTDDVLQTGITAAIDPTGATQFWTWYEWFSEVPLGVSLQTFLSEFPYVAEQPIAMSVKPGDRVTAVVQYVTDSSNNNPAGYISLGNNTTGQNFSIVLDQPTGAARAGATAEWIVERPGQFNSDGSITLLELPEFSPVTFNSALCCATNIISDPADTITMLDDFGDAITSEQIISDEVIVDYEAPAAAGLFDSISFVIQTGGDDLRGDSALTAAVSLSPGTVPSQVIWLKTKGQPSWQNNSTTDLTFPLASPVTSADLPGSLLLTLIQGGSWPETPDNWNMQSIVATLVDSTGKFSPFVMLNEGGNPLNRFTGSNGTFTLPLL